MRGERRAYPARGTQERAKLVARLADRAKFVRRETVRLAEIPGAGHYTGTFSAAELFAALYYAQLRYRPDQPGWPERDRLVLSKGHAAIGLYPVLADVGFFDHRPAGRLHQAGQRVRRPPRHAQDQRASTSAPGPSATGCRSAPAWPWPAGCTAWATGSTASLGDGELGEGQVWEAAMAAGHFRARVAGVHRGPQPACRSTAPTEDLMGIEPLADKFASFRWSVQRIDGHDLDAILDAYDGWSRPDGAGRRCIIADTVKGRGVRRMEGDIGWHVGRPDRRRLRRGRGGDRGGPAAAGGWPRRLTGPPRRRPRRSRT